MSAPRDSCSRVKATRAYMMNRSRAKQNVCYQGDRKDENGTIKSSFLVTHTYTLHIYVTGTHCSKSRAPGLTAPRQTVLPAGHADCDSARPNEGMYGRGVLVHSIAMARLQQTSQPPFPTLQASPLHLTAIQPVKRPTSQMPHHASHVSIYPEALSILC